MDTKPTIRIYKHIFNGETRWVVSYKSEVSNDWNSLTLDARTREEALEEVSRLLDVLYKDIDADF